VLLAELRVRGIDAAVAAAALDQVLNEESVSDLDLARKAARRRRPRVGEDAGRWQRRIEGFLSRKGFGHDTVRQVIAELRSERKADNE
jgi:SOS response regulatory protein OraA/RecX